ncbi:hypothetical protein QHE53_21175, partial [Aeromonas salmonicida]|uniref:hypothetical protein n=1 Tax=Aeromonas salmonicida TaxID=645 RepID=UPI0024786C58
PGVAGSSPVRSATNLKAFPIGKAFLLSRSLKLTRFNLLNISLAVSIHVMIGLYGDGIHL